MPARKARTRVVVLDSDRLVADAIGAALERERDLAVVGATAVPAEAERLAARERPEVALVDLGLVGEDPVDLIRRLRSDGLPTRVLAVVGAQSDVQVARAVEAGADGYLRKSQPLADTLAMVRMAARGDRLISPQESRRLLGKLRHRRAEQASAQQRADRLTRREIEILQHMADGAASSEIPAFLGMSPATLRTHVQNILTKLGVHSKAEALAFAIRHGKVAPRP